jgi:hypothetical protein
LLILNYLSRTDVHKYFSYRGVCSEHLKTCDHLFELIQELPLSEEALQALEEYEPRGIEETRKIESQNSRSPRTPTPNVPPVQETTSEKTNPESGSKLTGFKRTDNEPSESTPKRGKGRRKNPLRNASKKTLNKLLFIRIVQSNLLYAIFSFQTWI